MTNTDIDPQVIEAAKDWADDCWDLPMDYTDDEYIALVQRRYDGGIAQLITDSLI